MSVKRMPQVNGTDNYGNESNEENSRDMNDLNTNLLLSYCLMKSRCLALSIRDWPLKVGPHSPKL